MQTTSHTNAAYTTMLSHCRGHTEKTPQTRVQGSGLVWVPFDLSLCTCGCLTLPSMPWWRVSSRSRPCIPSLAFQNHKSLPLTKGETLTLPPTPRWRLSSRSRPRKMMLKALQIAPISDPECSTYTGLPLMLYTCSHKADGMTDGAHQRAWTAQSAHTRNCSTDIRAAQRVQRWQQAAGTEDRRPLVSRPPHHADSQQHGQH
jgi:hypothetical protein